jgi:hypothetical protein
MISRVSTPRARRNLLLAVATVLSSPAFADHMGPSGVGGGGGFNVLSPDTLDEGHAAVGFRLTYTRPDRRSDEKLEELAGQSIHAHNSDYNLNAAVGAAYGVTHELTVSAELPYVRRDRLREGEGVGEVERLGTISGIGDVNILARYRLLGGKPLKFAVIGGIKLPTGNTHRKSRDGERLETEHQPGTGSWDPIVGAAAESSLGSVTLSASGLYQFSGKGAQRTRLGDRMQGGIALSHRFGGEAVHQHHDGQNHHHGDELDEQHEAHVQASWDAFVELTGEWEGRQTVAGEVEEASGGKSVWISPGARFTSAGGWSIGAALGVPVWQRIRASHPDNDYRLSLSVGRAF